MAHSYSCTARPGSARRRCSNSSAKHATRPRGSSGAGASHSSRLGRSARWPTSRPRSGADSSAWWRRRSRCSRSSTRSSTSWVARDAVLVIEDVHWADEATLDVLRLLGRRIRRLDALVVVTYRSDELPRTHPLRVVLGDVAAAAGVGRLRLDSLSPEAVAELARPFGVDAEDLYAKTAGNPFFVTEALASGDAGTVPANVRDAVLARAARLEPRAGELLDAVAVVPPRSELWLLEAIAGEAMASLEECVASGMLRFDDQAVAFRHELARLAIDESINPHRRVELHRSVLRALRASAGDRVDPARLAHHAEAARDAEAVLELAPAAAEHAAAVGAHREEAAQYVRALRFADGLPDAARGELQDRRAFALYLIGEFDEAIDAAKQAVESFRRAGDRLREGDALRSLSRLLRYVGRIDEAMRRWQRGGRDPRVARTGSRARHCLRQSLPPPPAPGGPRRGDRVGKSRPRARRCGGRGLRAHEHRERGDTRRGIGHERARAGARARPRGRSRRACGPSAPVVFLVVATRAPIRRRRPQSRAGAGLVHRARAGAVAVVLVRVQVAPPARPWPVGRGGRIRKRRPSRSPQRACAESRGPCRGRPRARAAGRSGSLAAARRGLGARRDHRRAAADRTGCCCKGGSRLARGPRRRGRRADGGRAGPRGAPSCALDRGRARLLAASGRSARGTPSRGARSVGSRAGGRRLSGPPSAGSSWTHPTRPRSRWPVRTPKTCSCTRSPSFTPWARNPQRRSSLAAYAIREFAGCRAARGPRPAATPPI